MSEPTNNETNKSRKLVKWFHRQNGMLNTRFEFYKTDEPKDEKCCCVLIPKWLLIVASVACCFITALLITAITIAAVSRRPGLYGEDCQSRSCLSTTGLKCINHTCTCLENQYYATECLNKRDYQQSCSSTVPCKDNTNLQCLNGMCECKDTSYWNNSACVPKNTYKQTCKSDVQCLTNLMLNCDTKTRTCQCNSTRYWDGVECTLKRTINETCASTSDCISTQSLNCISGICTCSSFVYQYWDTTYKMCMNKINENYSCSGTYQCFTPMTCTSGACKCSAFQYFNISTFTCMPQNTVSQPCVVDYNCRVDKGLVCTAGICQCASTTPTWITAWSTCIKLQTYTGSCSSNLQCDSSLGLQCNTAGASGSCNCPYSTSNQCDCVRVNNNENYWNGSACVPAGSFGQTCVANTNYTCQTITQKTMCNSTGYCSCGTNGGLKSSSQECVSCGIGWKYVNEMCYRIETSAGASNSNGDGSPIDTACNVNVPSGGSGSLQLAFLNNQAALDYFNSISVAGQQYWVNLHKSNCNSGSNTCYLSCSGGCGGGSNWWIVYNSGGGVTNQFCNSPNGNNCGYYDFNGGCYGDDSCSTNLPYYCEYRAV